MKQSTLLRTLFPSTTAGAVTSSPLNVGSKLRFVDRISAYSDSYLAAGGTRTQPQAVLVLSRRRYSYSIFETLSRFLFEYEYEYHFIEYEYGGKREIGLKVLSYSAAGGTRTQP